MKKEQWRSCCEGYYEVSDRGRVRRKKPGSGTRVGLIIKAWTNRKGYRCVGFYCHGARKTNKVHRLVATAFIGPCPKGMEVNHKDGTKANNNSSNLEYLSHAGNIQHARRTGLMPSKIPQSTVDRVRSLRKLGMSYRGIAKETGVSRRYCRQLAANDSRKTPL